jgi:ribosomal protein S12 methylthiotransferase accessory factor
LRDYLAVILPIMPSVADAGRQSLERQYTPEQALALFDEELEALGLRKIVKSWGIPGLETTHCLLFDAGGAVISQGSGKGFARQSFASAAFEALEHYYARVGAGFCETKLFCATQARREGLLLIGDEFCAAGSPAADRETHWVEFQSLFDWRPAFAPAFAIDPAYFVKPLEGDQIPFDDVSAVASTCGGAAGCSLEEALVHALNEQVEHHAEGAFRLEAFVARKKRATLVRRETLPESLRTLIEKIEARAAEEVFLFYMPDNLGIPAFAAATASPRVPVKPIGIGASLSSVYAAERALLELLQGIDFIHVDVMKTLELNERAQRLDGLHRWPELRAAAAGDIVTAMRASALHVREIGFEEIPSPMVAHMPLDGQLRMQLELLRAGGYEPFCRTTYASQRSGITCLKVHIPDFDNTWLLMDGLMVRPNRRSLERLRGARANDCSA